MSAVSTVRTERLSQREIEAWGGFLQTHARIVKLLDAQMRAEHDMSLSAFEVLLHLARATERRLRMSELAEGVLLTPSGITRVVDRLVRAGLVSRRSCESDLRVTYAAITDDGLERFREAQRTHFAGVRGAFLDHFSSKELATLGEAWQRLTGPPPACE